MSRSSCRSTPAPPICATSRSASRPPAPSARPTPFAGSCCPPWPPPTPSSPGSRPSIPPPPPPGAPPTIENPRGLIPPLFFTPRRYDLGKVGRYKVNKRLAHGLNISERVLVPEDLIAIVREIVRLNNGFGKPDDIDHLGNRRVRTVGELIQNQFRIGLLRMERVIRERMTITDPHETAPS